MVTGHLGPPVHVGGGRGGGRHPYGNTPLENDRWLRAAPLPPVPAQVKMPQLHKTANRFEASPPSQIWLKIPDYGAAATRRLLRSSKAYLACFNHDSGVVQHYLMGLWQMQYRLMRSRAKKGGPLVGFQRRMRRKNDPVFRAARKADL